MSMERLVSGLSGQPRFYAVLVGIFGLIAAAIAGIGIYGVLAYAVAQRTREIGIRLALGAERSQVLGLVLKPGTMLAAAGLGVGLTGSAGLTRYLSGMLFGLTPLDLPTYAAVAAGFAAIAMIASYIPARRAARVDPLVSLRAE
jgi:putative ABC transport system permease protein